MMMPTSGPALLALGLFTRLGASVLSVRSVRADEWLNSLLRTIFYGVFQRVATSGLDPSPAGRTMQSRLSAPKRSEVVRAL